MKRSPDFLHFIGAALIIAFIGGGCTTWFLLKRQAAQKEWEETEEKIKKAGGEKEAAENFVHIREGILQTQIALEQAGTALNEARQYFQSAFSALTKESGPNPDEWKRMLRTETDELRKLAETNHVQLNDKFCCGFDEFRWDTPSTKQVADLTAELLASAQLCRLLLEEGVSEIKTVRRLTIFKNSQNVHDFYRLYSFEFKFSCRPDAFRRLLNAICSSPWLFIPQTLTVSNTHNPSKEKENLPTNKTQPFFVISGNEDIQINMRVDFLFWNRPQEGNLFSLK